MTDVPFRDEPLGQFLDQVASDAPAPGGGAVTAVTTALAAGLVAMVARFSSRQMADAIGVAEEADRLRARAIGLADDDAGAYREVLAAYAVKQDGEGRVTRIRAALERAADVPLAVAHVAADTALIGARLVASSNPNLTGDAVVAVHLAEAAARAAVTLVELNVRLGKLDGSWLEDSAAHLATAAKAATSIP